jgi:hypothetical protein
VHNTYKTIGTEWVSCAHPITLKKLPDWKRGDPAMVNYRTGDVPISEIKELANCPTWEAA